MKKFIMISSLSDALRRYKDCQRGNVTMIFVAAIFVLFGMIAFAIDEGNMRRTQKRMQTVVDTVALSSGSQMPDKIATTARAIVYAKAHYPSAKYGTVLGASDIEFGEWDGANFNAGGDESSVRMTMRLSTARGNGLPTYFMKLFGKNTINVSASAILSAPLSPNCLVVLDPNASPALDVKSNATLDMKTCGIHVNSKSNNALVSDSNAVIDAQNIATVGGYAEKSNSTIGPTPKTGASKLADPLGALPEPSTTGCDARPDKIDTGTVTIQPGKYCSGLEITSNAVVTFAPGEYIIKSGEFKVDSNAVVKGTDIFIFVAPGVKIFFGSNTTIEFTAATTGRYKGVLFFSARNNTEVHNFDSNTAVTVDGALYFPNATFVSNSNSQMAQGSTCFRLIAKTAQFDSNSGLNLPDPDRKCASHTAGGLAGGGIQLVR